MNTPGREQSTSAHGNAIVVPKFDLSSYSSVLSPSDQPSATAVHKPASKAAAKAAKAKASANLPGS